MWARVGLQFTHNALRCTMSYSRGATTVQKLGDLVLVDLSGVGSETPKARRGGWEWA